LRDFCTGVLEQEKTSQQVDPARLSFRDERSEAPPLCVFAKAVDNKISPAGVTFVLLLCVPARVPFHFK
jgi:hypothetical protein